MEWTGETLGGAAELAKALTTIQGYWRLGTIDTAAYVRLRDALETRLSAVRPPRRPPPPVASELRRPAAPPPPTMADQVAFEPAPPPESRVPRQSLGAWAAARQADILLYLGAFLLSISALIFVTVQGSGLGGGARFGILVAYTVAFLGLGRLLSRWDRVKEAGPVFIALGAILVPVDFIALRTQVLNGGEVPDAWLWLLGSGASAGLCGFLAARGFGRFYVVPAIPAALIAWGSLGVVLNFPDEWFGAWFMALAAVLYVGGSATRPGAGRWLRAGAFTLAAPALLFSLVAVQFSENSNGPLPATFALATAAIGAGLAMRREVVKLAMFAPLLALTALTTAWAIWGIEPEWWGAFGALSASAYLVIAHRAPEPEAPSWWGCAATVPVALGLLVTHAVTADGGAAHAALPVTYALALGVTTVAVARWRWAWRPAVGALSPLIAATAAATVWAAWRVGGEWYPLFALAAAAGYLVTAHLDEERSASAWGWLSLLAGAGAVAGTQVAMLPDGVSRAPLPAAFGGSLGLAVAAYGRFRWRTALGLVPHLTAGFAGTLVWSAGGGSAGETDNALGWVGAWAAGAAIGHLVIGECDRPARDTWRVLALCGGIAALTWAHVAAMSDSSPVHGPLPVAYGVLLAGAAWDALRRRDEGQLLVPALAAGFGVSLLWANGVPARWWAFPMQGAGAAMLLTWHWWRGSPTAQRFGWSYLLVLAVAPAAIFAGLQFDHPALGLSSQFGAAGALFAASLFSRGGVARLVRETPSKRALFVERQLLARLGSLALLAGAGSTNGLLGITGADRAWIFAGISALGWLTLMALHRRPEAFGILAPAATMASISAALIASEEAGHATAVFALAAVGPLAAFLAARRWSLPALAYGWAVGMAVAAWEWRDYADALLPLALAGVAAALCAGLTRERRYDPPFDERRVSILLLSWGSWFVALVAAVIVLGERSDHLAPGMVIAETGAWRTLAIVVAGASAAVTLEGIRLRLRVVWGAGTAGLLVAALLAVAIAQPSNVQAYTALVGGYLIIGSIFGWRRSEALFGPHMDFHEAATLAGALVLVLPPAEQSFQPNGGQYGLELIGVSVVLLAAGLLLHARWLVPAGAVTLSAVGVRFLTGGFVTVPYWALLAGAGALLIGVGMLLLLQRERWDAYRREARRWWLASPAADADGAGADPGATAGF